MEAENLARMREADEHAKAIIELGEQFLRGYTGEAPALPAQALPPLNLLQEQSPINDGGIETPLLPVILKKFKFPTEIDTVVTGPTVSTVYLKPEGFHRFPAFARLEEDLAFYMKEPKLRLRKDAKCGMIAVEVPNKNRVALRLSALIHDKPATLSIPAGISVEGEPVWIELKELPHLLMAGTTGSGKSVFLNSILLSLLMFNSPSELELVLVDPKKVEFSAYEDLPHLFHRLCYTPTMASDALARVTVEIERRYGLFKQDGVRNIEQYNALRSHLPYIVIVIDELTALFDDDTYGDAEDYIISIAQIGRAAGVHMVLSTQRPSYDIVKGRIKANFPARIGFLTATGVDSRVILDRTGAEKLLGRGDAIAHIPGKDDVRFQACMVTNDEIMAITEYWRNAR